MKSFAQAILAILAINVSGCTTYRAVGGFTDGSGVLYGNVSADLWTGTAQITVKEYGGSLVCEGQSEVTKGRESFDCSKQGGVARFQCNDGRRATAYWDADSCTTGKGIGKDTGGNQFEFVFGLDDEEAAEKLLAMSSQKHRISQAELAERISVFSEKAAAKDLNSSQISDEFANVLLLGALAFLTYEAAQGTYAGFGAEKGIADFLLKTPASQQSSSMNPCNCHGYAGPGGPCYAGPGGPAFDGPGGPAYAGPGGPCFAGPGGAEYAGPGGPAYDGPGGPRYAGPGGPAFDGPGGPSYDGPGGPCFSGPGGPCYSGPGGTGERCPSVCR